MKNTPRPIFRTVTIGGQDFRTATWEGDPAVRPLLFFNGIGANIEVAQPLADRLNHSRTLISFDPPGIGGSPDARLPYRLSGLASSASRIIEELGHNRVDVYGVSWGGGLAQQFTWQYPEKVRCLILAATSPGVISIPGHPSVLAKMVHPERYNNFAYLSKNFESLYGDLPRDVLNQHFRRIRPPTSRGYLYQLMAMTGWTSLPFLRRIQQPTLILAGDRDRIVPLANAQILNNLIPNARLQVIKGAGHLFFISRVDEKVPMIRNFLRQYKKRGLAAQTQTAQTRAA